MNFSGQRVQYSEVVWALQEDNVETVTKVIRQNSFVFIITFRSDSINKSLVV